MSDGWRLALASGLAAASLSFAFLLAWRTLRRARRRARDARKVESERQPGLRAEVARRLEWTDADLPDLGGWKITPDFACLLLDLVVERAPAHVLELGAGASTILLARALQREQPHATLSSLEEDADHAAATRRDLERRGLSSRADVQHAPLAAWPDDAPGQAPWYDPAALARVSANGGPQWDLVVVDGPATTGRADARFGALPRLLDRLSPRAIVVLDDAARPGERAVVAAWRGMGLLRDFDVEVLPLARGAVVLRRRT